ncbi:MAG: sulfotransferase [Gammaproteobacteria bacterium]|nr:sulfotransferase [Gammaproteobacteria bacterium]NNF61810.1 tetratricopeptide repeat protein [Gammaproteobacteria bacterium]NNM19734.1 tetratricopeptide repeat protein [Gammaproteobacteria bacterium]
MQQTLETLSNQQLLQRGFAALNRGRLGEAEACCRTALLRSPDLAPGHFLVGLVALEAQDRRTAFSAFRSVTRLEPAHAAAWAHLARLFITDGQVNRADAALREVLRHVRDEAIVEDLVGTVYSRMGEYGLAAQWYEKAIEHQKDHPPFLLNHANNLVYHGETAAAQDVFRRIIDIQPLNPQAHWALAAARKATDEQHIVQMQRILTKGVHPRAQAFYCYAIGKEYEDLQEWDAAFRAFAAGARARRSTVEFDEQAEIEMFRFLEESYLPERLSGSGHDSAAPIFVLGQPRTGTTLIERIIGSHSLVHPAGELQQFALAIRRLADYNDAKRFSAEMFAAALDLNFTQLGAMYLDTTRRMQGETPRFIDKLPQNYLMIPLILAALPNAKIVHLTRDPMDACFASFKQLFADAYLHSYDQQEMARHHVRYRRLMQVWRDRFPGRFFDISYEETVTDLEPAVRDLLGFLELPFEKACMEFHRQDAAVSTASAVQVRQPVHTRSVGRWKKYAGELQPMLETLQHNGVEVTV